MGNEKGSSRLKVSQSALFIPGNIQNCFAEWAALTDNSYVLDVVQFGLTLDFIDNPDLTLGVPTHNFSSAQSEIISREVQRLVSLQVIAPSILTNNSYVSRFFTTPKKDNSHRFILNLKLLNTQIKYIHFKLESISDVKNIISSGVWMASIDLRDAYYSIPIHPSDRCKLAFSWQGVLYEFTCLPNGYTQGPYVITKLFKVPFRHLRSQGFPSVFYFDDSYLQGDSYQHCLDNITATVSLLERLGFTINIAKSVLVPTQEIEFLGFVLNSATMQMRITAARGQKMVRLCSDLLSPGHPSIRKVTAAIGAMVSALQGTKYGALHYRSLEACRNKFLKIHRLNYDMPMTLSPAAIADIHWWLDNALNSSCFIHPPPVSYTFYTDASLEGWGGTDMGRLR